MKLEIIRPIIFKYLEKFLPPILSLMFLLGWSQIINSFQITYYTLDGGLAQKILVAYIISPKIDRYILIFLLLITSLLLASINRRNICILILQILFTATYLFYIHSISLILNTIIFIISIYILNKNIFLLSIEKLFQTIFIIEILASIYYLGIIFRYNIPYIFIAAIWDQALFNWLQPITPILVLIFLGSPLIKQAINSIKDLTQIKIEFNRRQIYVRDRMRKIILIATFLAAIFIPMIMYMPTLNPSGIYKGVDPNTRYYPHLKRILSGNPLINAVRIGYDRPTYYIMMYLLSILFGVDLTIKILPIISMLIFVTAIYFSMKRYGQNIATAAATLSLGSYTVTAGLYGGLYSNWLSLAFIILSISSLTKYLEKNSYKMFGTFILTYFLALSIHAYIGAVYTIILSIYLIYRILFYRNEIPRTIKPLLIIIIIIALFTYTLYFKPIYGTYRGWSRIFTNPLYEISNLFTRKWWHNFNIAVYNYGASSGLDPYGWILSTLGLLTLKKKRVFEEILIVYVLLVAPLSLTAPTSLIYRAIYDIPIAIYEIMGLLYIGREEIIKPYILLKINRAISFTIGLTL